MNLKQKLLDKIYAFIPSKVPSRLVLWGMKLLSKISGRISEHDIRQHREYNRKLLLGNKVMSTTYIENQQEWKNVVFGMGKIQSLGYSGCEIIAAYNAKKAVSEAEAERAGRAGNEVAAERAGRAGNEASAEETGTKEAQSLDELLDLISCFEKKGAMRKGDWGVSPHALLQYFKEKEFCAFLLKGTENNLSELEHQAQQAKALILTYFNNQLDIRDMVHTICISKEDGMYMAHNCGMQEKNENRYASLKELIVRISKKNPIKIIAMIVIQ